jgi:hypothetical protein
VEGACGFGSAALVTLAFNTGWYVCISEIAMHVGTVVQVTKGSIGFVKPKVTKGVMG